MAVHERIQIILIWLQFHKNPKTSYCFLVLFIVCTVKFGRQLLTGSNEIKRLSLKSFQDVQNIVPSLVIGTSKDKTPMMITNIFYSQSLGLKSLLLRVVFTNFSSYLFPCSTENSLVRLFSWLRPPRHLPLQKRQPTMPGCAVFWWMLDLKYCDPLLTKYIHRRLYTQFWEVPQCTTVNCNHCTKGRRKCWILLNGGSFILLIRPCHPQPLTSHSKQCCLEISVVWALLPLVGIIFPQLLTQALRMTSPEWSITGTLYTAMHLKPLWMTLVSVLIGRKYEKLWWDWEEPNFKLISTNLSTTAWIQISRSIIVNWWNNGRKTTIASRTNLKRWKVRWYVSVPFTRSRFLECGLSYLHKKGSLLGCLLINASLLVP